MALAGILALASAVRALRFWDGFTSWAHSDDMLMAVPATQILSGALPVHHVGVDYHGAAPAYPLAVWFALTGPSTLTLDVFCWAIGVAIAWTGYLLACRLLPSSAAFLAGLVLAVPPLVFTRWTTTGNLVYPVTLLIGNLILLGTHRTFGREPAPAATVFVTGLLAGLGWWTNPLVIIYCAPFGVLAFRTGFVRRAWFWLFPMGVILGGLPAWLYEITHFPSTRLVLHEAGGLAPEPLSARVTMFLNALSLELVGARATELATVPFVAPTPLQAIVVGLGLMVVVRAVVRDRRELSWLVGARAGAGTGLSALWIVLVTNLALALPTKRSLGITYFLPLYAVLPLWTGEFLAWLWSVRRWVGATTLVGLLGFYLWATWAVTLGRRSDAGWRWSELRAITRPVVDWLTVRGIRHIYYDYDYQRVRIPAFELTFLTGMRVTAAHPWHEQVVQHGQAVDAQRAPPFVVTVDQADDLRQTLSALAQPVRETRIGTVVVFETDPVTLGGFTAIPPDRWTVTASHRPSSVRHLVDRDAATQWSTGRAQTPGQWVAVDLGVEEEVTRIDLLTIDWQEVPAGFRVECSRDGQVWQEAVSVPHYWGPLFFSEHHPFIRVRRGRVQAIFEPVRARFVRITQTGKSASRPWSARELLVYRPAPGGPRDPEPAALTRTLRREGVGFVYASHWLSARVLAEANGKVGALDSNINVNSYGLTRPDPTSLERFRLEKGRALLLGADADVQGSRRMLEIQGALERETSVGPYRLILLKRPMVRRPLARDGWRMTASVAAAEAPRALDGDPGTRWSAGAPVSPDIFVTLDLAQVRPVGGLRIVPGSRDGGPPTLALESSPDGLTWAAIGPTEWAGPLYWTGYELLRNSRREWTVVFPQVRLRYLRIRPAIAARTWDIEEIDLFE